MYNTVTLSSGKFLGVVRWGEGQQQLVAMFYATKEADKVTREFCALQNRKPSDEREAALVSLSDALVEHWPRHKYLMSTFVLALRKGIGDG